MKNLETESIDKWLAAVLPRQRFLTKTVVTITESLLKAHEIDYLAITGRTKTLENIRDKVRRKSYKYPQTQLTDISGIRVIVYFESDVHRVSDVIESSFCVDKANSLDKEALLAADQNGYRSVHYVCDIGKDRALLPEFRELGELKFEFQIRTVLQHAWAELAHDRNYKFSGKLPREIERRLYLYAGMLEIADKGFDELSRAIDVYVRDLKNKTGEGDLDIEINSLSLEEYVDQWAARNRFPLEASHDKDSYGELVDELNQLGIRTLSDLDAIVPYDYPSKAAMCEYTTNIYGLVRDWLLIHDYLAYHDKVERHWSGFGGPKKQIFPEYFNDKQISEIYELFDHGEGS